tara:strand:- start:53856 stop:54152 length:297 start_codon:yes stop_codon:yes gene_type:complete
MKLSEIRERCGIVLQLPANNRSKERLKLPVSIENGKILWDKRTPNNLRKGSIRKEQHGLWTKIYENCVAEGTMFNWETRGNSITLSQDELSQIVERFA